MSRPKQYHLSARPGQTIVHMSPMLELPRFTQITQLKTPKVRQTIPWENHGQLHTLQAEASATSILGLDYQSHAVDKYLRDHKPPYPYYESKDNSSFGKNGGVYNRLGRAKETPIRWPQILADFKQIS